MLNNCPIRAFFLCFILATSLLNVAWPEKYTAESWVYASILDGAVSTPLMCFRVGRFAVGLPYRFGIGTTLFEVYGLLFPEPEPITGHLPLSIYYIPYANWHKNGSALPVIYTNLSMNIITGGYANTRYLRLSIGVTWLCAGLETGWISSLNKPFSGFVYGGITLSLGGWFGTNIKMQNQ